MAERGVLSGGSAAYAPASPAAVEASQPRRRTAPVESFGTAPGSVTLGRAAQLRRSLPVVAGDRQVRLDYRDAEITRVAREVTGDVLGLEVTVDPGVTGRMTLVTPAPIPLREVPRQLDEALAQFGYGLSAEGRRIRVGRIADLEAATGGQGETRLIPLSSVPAAEVIAALQGSLPEGVRASADPGGRGVIVTGSPAALSAAEGLVGIFDTDALRGRSFGLYPLANASAGAVVRELDAIFGASGLRVTAVERLNAVLVVTDRPQLLARARRTVAQLDTVPEASAVLQVVPVQNRRAQDLAEILSRAFGGAGAGASQRNSPVGNFGNLAVGGPTGNNAALGTRVPGLAAPPPGPPQPAAPQLTAAQQAAEFGLAGPVRIQADTGRNALVVLANPSDFNIIGAAIRRLDQRPRQVFIEAAIAEITLTDELRYGIDYSLKAGNGGLLSALAPLAAPVGGFAYVLNSTNISLTIQALSSLTTVKVVSAPRLLVLDNEVATLQVGNQVPILVQTSQSTESSGAPVVNSVELRDTGVILSVRARIGAAGSISLDLFQEVSNAVQNTTSEISSPTIQLRRLQSTVAAQSGETIALGGLMRDSSDNRRAGIPVLSDLPVVGPLFGSRAQTNDRTELLVLMTPRVVEDSFDMQSLVNELRAKVNSLAPDLGSSVTPPPRSLRLVPPLAPPRAPQLDLEGRLPP